VRVCMFCGVCGDDDGGVQVGEGGREAGDSKGGSPLNSGSSGVAGLLPVGRLLPADPLIPGSWVHSQCLLWSSEVWEDEKGRVCKHCAHLRLIYFAKSKEQRAYII